MRRKVLPQSRKTDIVVQDLNREVLIYDLNLNKAFCLNETSALVWQACDGTKSVSEISQAISKKLNEPASEDLVWLALDQLKKKNLLDNSEEIVPNFYGVSRREVIKKVGLTTMIALPFISSLVAPTPLMAQSAASCGGQTCKCTDFFVTASPPGTQCTGADIVDACPTAGCRCLSNGDAATPDDCSV
jgi:hypothetical protein